MSEAKSYIRTLQSVDGTERLQFLALVAKEGFSFYITRSARQEDGKYKVQASGARTKVADYATGKTKVDAAVKVAQEKGWVAPVTKRGPGTKADDFSLDNLPAPSGAAQPEAPEAENKKAKK